MAKPQKNPQKKRKKERNVPASERKAMRPPTLALYPYKTQDPIIMIWGSYD